MGCSWEDNEIIKGFIEEKQAFKARTKKLDLIYIVLACILITIWAAYYFELQHLKIKLPVVNLNPAIKTGNTGGNIVNGGIAGTDNEWIYYASYEDDYKIYKIRKDRKNKQRVTDDSAKGINIMGDWIYYINLSDGEKIYRIKKDGSLRKMITKDKAGVMCTAGEFVYYINNSDNGKLYRIRDDGSEKRKIDDDSITSFNLSGNYIYYSKTYDSPGIYKIKMDGSGKRKVSAAVTNWIIIQDKYIYCFDINKKLLYKMKTDGSEKKVIPSEFDSMQNEYGINISNQWIYYAYGNAVKRMKLDGTFVETLLTSNSPISSISIVDNWIYYTTASGCLGKVKNDGTAEDNEENLNLIDTFGYNNNTVNSDNPTSQLLLTAPSGINESYRSSFGIYGGYIYYIDKQNNSIERVSLSGVRDDSFKITNSSLNPKLYGEWILYKKLPSNKVRAMKLDRTYDGTFFNEPVDYFSIYEGWFYYSKYNTGEFYRIRVDDKKIEKIASGKVLKVNIYDKYIYYLDEYMNLYRINTDGTNKIVIGKNILHYLVFNNYVYYIDLHNDSGIFKMKSDGNDAKMLASPSITAFTFQSDYIYFSKLEGSKNNLYRVKSDGTNLKKIAEGFIDVIEIADNWIYYYDDFTKTLNKVKTDGTQNSVVSSCNTDSIYILNDWIYYNSLNDNKLYRISKDGTGLECIN